MGNTKNLENEKVIKCPECGADGTATGIKTPDGRLPMYRCSIESCGAIFTAEDWLNCPSCHQQGELTSEVTDDDFEVCLCKNRECPKKRFQGRKVEEVQVCYTSQLTGDEAWDVCPTCGKVGRNSGAINGDGRTIFICVNGECPEYSYAGGMEEQVTPAAVGEPTWRKRLDESIAIMQACINAAVDLHPDDVDAHKSLAGEEYTALCNMRSDCALALFKAVSTETTAVMDAMGKAASVLEGIGKTETKTAIMMVTPKGLIPMPPEWGKDGD